MLASLRDKFSKYLYDADSDTSYLYSDQLREVDCNLKQVFRVRENAKIYCMGLTVTNDTRNLKEL